MNKKYIAFSFMAVFALTLVSAGLVNYLSNTVEVSANIESPFTFGISDSDGTYDNSVDYGIVFGGDDLTLYTKITNNANARIEGGVAKIVIDNQVAGEPTTCDEFDSIVAYVTENNAIAGNVDCSEDSGKVVLTTGDVRLDGGDSQKIYFVVGTNPAINPSSNYAITGKVLVA